MLFFVPLQEPTVTIHSRAGDQTEYIVEGAQSFRVVDKLPAIAASVSRDGTLWIVHGYLSEPLVRAVNPKLKIQTGSSPLVLSPYGYWDSRSGEGTPSPLPAPSPANLKEIQALTPGQDAAPGYSGVLRIPHEDGSRTEVLLVEKLGGEGHVFIIPNTIKGTEKTPFFGFANKTKTKLRLLKPDAPNYVQATIPGTKFLDTARLIVRVVDSHGIELAYVVGPALANMPNDGVTTRIYNRPYSTISRTRG